MVSHDQCVPGDMRWFYFTITYQSETTKCLVSRVVSIGRRNTI